MSVTGTFLLLQTRAKYLSEWDSSSHVNCGTHAVPFWFQGECDVICGGPPCQGASGFNRFRNKADPLADPRNKQMVVYMDIVDFLRPRFFLMENVVDILKFCGGILGRYALARAVGMNYQVYELSTLDWIP